MLTAATDSSLELHLLHAVLNQVDYGLAVVATDTHTLLFANAPALAALHPDSPLKTGLTVVSGHLRTRKTADAEQLNLALQRTKLGQRALLQLHDATHPADPSAAPGKEAAVAVMPLSTPGYALLAFAKQQMCDTTSVTLFARERGLTSAEGQVLAQVCKGLRAQQIATHQGVQVSTVRTQLRAIRQKTASDSVRELVEKVSVLPPLALNLSLNLPQLMDSFASQHGRPMALS
jgi:DNA-binding CsgD family transcriptional regulator